MDKNKFELLDFNKLLKATDVADILTISRAMAYRLMQIGEITSVNIGANRRVRPKDLIAFIDRNLAQDEK
jgi:hypothetical protein